MNRLSILRCKKITIASLSPENSNAIALDIHHHVYGHLVEDDGRYGCVLTETSLTLFGLPEAVTDALIAALSPEKVEDAA